MTQIQLCLSSFLSLLFAVLLLGSTAYAQDITLRNTGSSSLPSLGYSAPTVSKPPKETEPLQATQPTSGTNTQAENTTAEDTPTQSTSTNETAKATQQPELLSAQPPREVSPASKNGSQDTLSVKQPEITNGSNANETASGSGPTEKQESAPQATTIPPPGTPPTPPDSPQLPAPPSTKTEYFPLN